MFYNTANLHKNGGTSFSTNKCSNTKKQFLLFVYAPAPIQQPPEEQQIILKKQVPRMINGSAQRKRSDKTWFAKDIH